MTKVRVKPNFKIGHQSSMHNMHGVLIHYYEILDFGSGGVSIGISGIDNPDALANDICGAINKYINFDFEVEKPDDTSH